MDTNLTRSTAGAKPDEPRVVVQLELTEQQRIEFQKIAERCGLSLDEWMIDRLNLAAKREAKEA